MTSREIVVDITSPDQPVLSASLTPSFDYTRSTGPVLGAFFTGLRDRRIVGVRDSRGAVHVPPVEFDPHTRAPLTETVEVGSGDGVGGVVVAWTWVPDPTDVNPLDTPFAWVLVRFDGADTAMLLALAADGPEAVSTGMRVRVRWSAERRGDVHDIACVVPERHDDDNAAGTPSTDSKTVAAEPATAEPVTGIVTPVGLSVTHTAAPAESEFLRAIVEGRMLGRRRSNGPEVYVPPRDYCPSDGVAMGEYVEVADVGTVTTFGIVNVPFAGQEVKPPYVTAYILLDGSDVPVQHLVLGCEASEVRIGMRVRAVWAPESERPASMKAITHFEPSGEPDTDPATVAIHP
ncbi:OB-fold nucleic acid binding domain-containing protein [Dietzia cinnamea]|uniref:OB-fold nucleic acid binding domain-containing protein n=1 Tax=Dietzia cinnamea TaxID=321318 RepID=UPI00223A6A43|nr:OB-fold nucleic acid binding domain-containing protein [Dietzia cinnamea]MCT2062238.1 OB-fold domain-containing protein [Dietzia cinnamea]MCT2237258.1 OB-fold domain-containing protein [Dietzia cinnamea]MCT2301933.1 OB-fold domain-containing protein [Dietzia cinnamea]